MRLFYRFLLVWAEFDLTIAKSTGRDPDHVRQLQRDVERWQHALLMKEINA